MISKQILGFSNRNPDSAANFAEGTAYVVIGAEPGQINGVTPLDVARLEGSLTPYLGTEGPIWAATYVPVQDKSVLVITVEAPAWGNPIYPLCKTYQPSDGKTGADDGTIFIRRQASTQPAKAAEHRMLQERLRRHTQTAVLALELQWPDTPVPLKSLDVSEEAQNRWLKARRRELLGHVCGCDQQMVQAGSLSQIIGARR
ncbi:hypothetical protein [Nonomuraea sp. KM90]|uniref:hypothetical protein n=1 Tax=Nonomuraea sp. KM90 TaxID=3457428 RepID=UPI003FCEDFD9